MNVLSIVASYRARSGEQAAYAHRLAKGLRARGHGITLLISDEELPTFSEGHNGLRVVTASKLVRVGALTWLPSLPFLSGRLVREHDVVNLHLPQWGAAGSALWGRALSTPLVLTYHRDLAASGSWLNSAVNLWVRLGSQAAGLLADRIVCSAEDFARRSSFLQRFRGKTEVIPPPVEVAAIGRGAVAAFRKMHRLGDHRPIIGVACAASGETGIEVLLRALPRVLEEYPRARVLCAGEFRHMLGEEARAHRLGSLLRKYEDHWTFLGELRPVQRAAFYPNVDMIVAPGVHPVESFGLVQAEAMLCGTPSIASNLPGLRQPVEQTGMGKVVPMGDSDALAKAIIEVTARREEFVQPRAEIAERWSTERTAREYENLFEDLLADRSD